MARTTVCKEELENLRAIAELHKEMCEGLKQLANEGGCRTFKSYRHKLEVTVNANTGKLKDWTA